MMFLRCQTQWRIGQSGLVGLDYNVVLGMLPLYPVERPTDLIEDLRVMENRAVQLINEEAAKAAKKAESKRRKR